MPPLTNDKRRPQNARQPSQLLNTRLHLIYTSQGSNGAADNGIELGGDSSPKADRAVVYFALERKRDDDDGDDDDGNGNSRNDDDNNSRNNNGKQRNGGRPKSNKKGGSGSGNNDDNKGEGTNEEFRSENEDEDNNGRGDERSNGHEGRHGGGNSNNNNDGMGGNNNDSGKGNDNGESNGNNGDGSRNGTDDNKASSSSEASTAVETSTTISIMSTTSTILTTSTGLINPPLSTISSAGHAITLVPSPPILLPPSITSVSPTTTSLTPLVSALPAESSSPVSLPNDSATATAATSSLGDPLLEFSTTTSPSSKPTQKHNSGHNGQGNKGHMDNMEMNPTIAKVLITIGVIGGLIILGLVGWLVYKRFIKPRRSNLGHNNRWLSRNNSVRQARTDAPRPFGAGSMEKVGLPPSYSTEGFNSMEESEYYARTKPNPYVPRDVVYQPPLTLPGDTLQRSQPASSLQSNMVPGQSNMEYAALGATLRSVSPYTVSELSRQASGATESAQRQAHRVSELSSISSGFGDGDIVIPPPLATTYKTQDIQPPDANQSRFSWTSRTEERRDTVFTTVSEDRPARHRSVNGWVDQQTSRVKRAFSRAKERGEVPIIPAIPGGQMNVTQQTAYR
ncbi:hypothetical protein GGR57DRAFT_496669 [Xylariaceae sp. FL1272]|nr:hypothetical protein GGR57DRAFT_496669 [Xylariaceae sp. FL1272]